MYIIRSHLDMYQNSGSDRLPDSWEIQTTNKIEKYSREIQLGNTVYKYTWEIQSKNIIDKYS